MAGSPKLKRPKNDGRCVHCLEQATTKDHVFPDSWYPESTPTTVQRWTVPCCVRCNGELGQAETEVFVRLALCVNPQKIAASGLSQRAIRSMGIRARELGENEKRIRDALKNRVLKGARPISEEGRRNLLPGLGPHPEAPSEQQILIDIPAELLHRVGKNHSRL